MRFGICAPVEQAAAVKAAGWDFVEENVQGLLQGNLSDEQWKGADRARGAVLPILAANMLVPAAMKITGPQASLDALRPYMFNVLKRAQLLGMSVLVFGSGGARTIPEGFDRGRARTQILDFVKMSADLAARHQITLVAEPLNKGETNVLNSVEEAMTYVREVNHPNFQCLVDSYHYWLEDDSPQDLRRAMPHIKHVHLADKVGRTAPGLSGQSDYRPFFRILKQGNYQGVVSVEAIGFKIAEDGAKVLDFVKKQWNEA